MIKFKINVAVNKKKEVTDKYKKVLMKAMFKMEELAIHKAPFDRGTLKGRITLFPQILSNKYILKSESPNSAVMEYGSRPFYADIKPLKAWAKRKFGDEDMAYTVQDKIAEEGITAQPYMRPALVKVKTYWLPEYMKSAFD